MTKDELQREIDKAQAEIDAELASLEKDSREASAAWEARVERANDAIEAATKRRDALLHEWSKEA